MRPPTISRPNGIESTIAVPAALSTIVIAERDTAASPVMAHVVSNTPSASRMNGAAKAHVMVASGNHGRDSDAG